MNNKGLLIVVSAPSGCGKGTILREILKDNSYYYSVSATTRQPRDEDKDGVTYKFLTKEQFEELIKTGGMLEYAEYCGNYYGTRRKITEDMLNSGKNVILEIEVQGAMQVKKAYKDAVMIFILPPSIKELERRLRKRGTETEDVIAERVETAKSEIEQADKYDYKIINDGLEEAIKDFKSVIEKAKSKQINNN